MPMTPAQRSLMRKRAAQEAAEGNDPHGPLQGTAHQLMLAQLYAHQRTLKGIQSIERKIEAKRTMVHDFNDYLAGVLEANAGVSDPVVTTALVWHLDVGNWMQALSLAHYCLQHGLQLPDQYQRNLPTLLLDEISEAAIKGQLQGTNALAVLARVDEATQAHDTHDQARAKLHKAIGWAAIGKTATHDLHADDFKKLPLDAVQIALEHLRRAVELHAQVGVKKDVERLERRFKELLPPAPN